VLRARELEVFAQDFEQRLVRRKRHLGVLAVQSELNVDFLFTRLRHSLDFG
jgi:hypothetical protein